VHLGRDGERIRPGDGGDATTAGGRRSWCNFTQAQVDALAMQRTWPALPSCRRG